MPHLRLLDADPALARWFDGGRLVAIPTKRGKRLPVLLYLADAFEPGVYYSEADVNATLRAFHPDVAALRRYLVEEGFMSRTRGGFAYWRTGGEFQPS
jgi:hypothetical protein